MRGFFETMIGSGVVLGVFLAGCASSLSQNFSNTLPGGQEQGRQVFGVQRSNAVEFVILDTTGMDSRDVIDAEIERFSGYMNKGLVPIGSAYSRNKGEKKSQAEMLAARYGACVAVVEIKDPPPYEKTINTQVPTLVTESVRVDGTSQFNGSVTRIGWGPGKMNVWVDPYSIECTLWAKRSWPPLLGVYFTEEMRSFKGLSDLPFWPTMKSAADRWTLRHTGKPPPRGAEVQRVIAGTVAERITLRPSDILVSIGGQPVTSEHDARQVIEAACGRDVELVVMRHMANRNLDEADGWTVSSPTNPLFQETKPVTWRQLTRRVMYPIIAQ
jgi:hypothetical protein